MFRRIVLPLTCFALVLCSRAVAAAPVLLQQAVDNWLGERDHWAFTQTAVEYADGVPHTRVERYDPSRPGDARWQLLTVDGHAPTQADRAKWADKKFKRHHRGKAGEMSISDFFDFDDAKVVAETPKLVRFEVPLRRDKNWLFPTDKVGVRVTINKQTRALEHLTAHVREPFRVLMGIARVTDGEADLDFLHFDAGTPPVPATSHPSGAARVSMSKMGERMDFTWTDFKRVTPYHGSGAMSADRLQADAVADLP